MATRTTIQLIDDIDGGVAHETVRFSLDGQPYEIDLSGANRQELDAALAGYIESARPVQAGGGPKRAAKQSGRVDQERKDRLKAMREWALANGITVAERGRIAASVEAAYAAAH